MNNKSPAPEFGVADPPPVPNVTAAIGPYQCGPGSPLLLIAGPCVIESEELALRIAGQLREITSSLPVQWVFKASFDKANRTSGAAFRGSGLEQGLRVLRRIHSEFGVPVTTDLHESWQAAPVAEVCDLLQIPAFLCRQTDLLVAAAQTGRAVHVKKGQFVAPWDMVHVVAKLRSAGCTNVLVCERGTFFGYGRLVNDMRALVQLRECAAPVIFDATHSVQEPGGRGASTGGQRSMVEPLARAATAIGIDGLFFETHPDPDQSPSDGPNMIPLREFPSLLHRLLAIRQLVTTFP
ncbi:MAG: 3-deoxy-8-phosphooctulonate synthase [Planctomycetes bacterium]|nr:3-deoxy-8-phosphooctulonate synthase [Planctomycetota bacterium]